MNPTYVNMLNREVSEDENNSLELLFKQLRMKKKDFPRCWSQNATIGSVPPFRTPPRADDSNDGSGNPKFIQTTYLMHLSSQPMMVARNSM